MPTGFMPILGNGWPATPHQGKNPTHDDTSLALWPSGPLALWPSGPLDYNTLIPSPSLLPAQRQRLRNDLMQSLVPTRALPPQGTGQNLRGSGCDVSWWMTGQSCSSHPYHTRSDPLLLLMLLLLLSQLLPPGLHNDSMQSLTRTWPFQKTVSTLCPFGHLLSIVREHPGNPSAPLLLPGKDFPHS